MLFKVTVRLQSAPLDMSEPIRQHEVETYEVEAVNVNEAWTMAMDHGHEKHAMRLFDARFWVDADAELIRPPVADPSDPNGDGHGVY